MSHLNPNPTDEFEQKKWTWRSTVIIVVPFYLLLFLAMLIPNWAGFLIFLAIVWVVVACAVAHES